MAFGQLHRFERDGKHFVIDPETCFCFECDALSREVLARYPAEPTNAIVHALKEAHDPKEVEEVISELEWLRATKSILPKPDMKAQLEVYTATVSLDTVTVQLAHEGEAVVRAATQMLVGRSAQGAKLRLSIRFTDVTLLSLAGELGTYARNAATLAGKELTVVLCHEAVELHRSPKELTGQGLALSVAVPHDVALDTVVQAVAKTGFTRVPKLIKALQDFEGKVELRARLCPQVATMVDAVQALHGLSIPVISLDFDGVVQGLGTDDIGSAYDALRMVKAWYAERLKAHAYFKLDPITSLFNRIYSGTPERRMERAGTALLHVARGGKIYPSTAFQGDDAFCLGSVLEGTFNSEAQQPFNDLGTLTTGPCMKCWARGLCGGGSAAVHHSRTGSIRKPDESWCDAQRTAMEEAVVAFNVLSTAGVNFTRVYAALGKTGRISFFQMAKAAMTMHLGLRPIEEDDAEQLTKWQNWSEAAYFTYNESGLMLSTKYDREMDSLHPLGLFQEFVMLRRDGSPIGLLKFQVDKLPGAATMWVYLKDPADYAEAKLRNSFKQVLKEAGGQQELKQLMVPVGPKDDGLADFLMAVGFVRSGKLREALYLHGTYHGVDVYRLGL